MAGIQYVILGRHVPLVLQLADDVNNLYVRAFIWDVTHHLLDSVDLDNITSGIYTQDSGSPYVMPDEHFIKVSYVVYTDAAYTIESDIYERDIDVFIQELPDQYKADVSDLALESTSEDILDKINTIPAGGGVRLKVESHTVSRYFKDMTGTTVIMVTLDGVPVSGVVASSDYYKPDNTIFLADQPFIEIGSTGVYYQNFSIPALADEGIYKIKIDALYEVGGSSFDDEFPEADGDADNWDQDIYGTWVVDTHTYKQTDDSQHRALASMNDSAALEWVNYDFECDVRIDSENVAQDSNAGIYGRYTSSLFAYYLFLDYNNNKIILYKNNGIREEANFVVNLNTWYTLKLSMSDGAIKGYVNGDLKIDYTDATPREKGKAALRVGYSTASFDNIHITVYGSEFNSYQVKDFIVESRDNYKADVTNLDVAISSRSSHGDPTNGIKGAPGKTLQEVFDNERGTDGANIVIPPTTAEIDTELTGTHGAGSWQEGAGGGATPAEIDLELTANHGAGSWQEGAGEYDGILATILSEVDGLDGQPIPSTVDITNEVFSRIVEGTLTFEQMQRVCLAMMAGTSSGHETAGPFKYKSVDGLKDRAEFTADIEGNRLSVVLDGS